MARGTGSSRGREGSTDVKARFLWRNMLFRNLGAGLSSALIESALEVTYREWARRYGALPEERLRTEIGVREVRSTNPGFCYLMAGWERGAARRGKLFLYAPARPSSTGASPATAGRPRSGPSGSTAPSTSLLMPDATTL